MPVKSQIYEVTFSDQSLSELNKMEIDKQMTLIETIGKITPTNIKNPKGPLGRFNRNGKTYYRLRAGEFRFYFEIKNENLLTQYILHKNTLTDFIFRSKLPLTEDQLEEQHQSFWKYLETLKK